MFELLRHMLLPYNVPLTMLVALALMYWMLSAVGVLGIELLDGLFDFGGDGGDAGGGDDSYIPFGSVFHSSMRFLNAQDVPVAMILSFLVVFLWLGSLLLNFHFNPQQTWPQAALLFLPNVVASVLLTRFATMPYASFMRKVKAQALTQISLKGRVGSVRTGEVSDVYGQVELDGDGALLINARVSMHTSPLLRGTRVTVVSEPDGNGVYTVIALDQAT